MVDLRWLLFAWAGWLFFRTRVYFRVWRHHRSMPLLLGLVLVSVFIWFSENIGTFTKIWLYPSQRHGWSMVSIDKLGSWFLLLIISYTLVSLINAPRERRRDEHAARRAVSRSCARARFIAVCSGLRCVYAADAVPEPTSPRPFCWLARMLCHSAATLRCVSGAIRQWP